MLTPKALLAATAFVLLSLGSSANARADAITIQASDSGWYNDQGFHDATNKNYIAGAVTVTGTPPVTRLFHDYFTFNLSGVNGTITGATLRITNPLGGYSGPAATYTLYDVSTAAATLSGSQTTRTDIFTDLGSGTVFGTLSVSAADDGTTVTINLNAAALAALNSLNGTGTFDVGGALSGVDSFIFGGTEGLPGVRELDLTTAAPTPEPATLILLGTGLAGLAAMARKWRSRHHQGHL